MFDKIFTQCKNDLKGLCKFQVNSQKTIQLNILQEKNISLFEQIDLKKMQHIQDQTSLKSSTLRVSK